MVLIIFHEIIIHLTYPCLGVALGKTIRIGAFVLLVELISLKD